MPDWNRIMKEIGSALEAAAKEAVGDRSQATGPSRATRNVTTVPGKPPPRSRTTPKPPQRSESKYSDRYRANRCLFWSCRVKTRSDHFLCYDHFIGLQDGFIDECQGCGLAKDVDYDLCLDCKNYKRSPKPATGNKPSYGWYKPEYSPAWDRGDSTATRFFVYILKLKNGKFYAGQTRDFRERLSEHRDSKTASTANQNPKLVWFTTVRSREQAANMEVELKKLIDSNERQIRRMVQDFKDWVGELDYS